MAEGVALVARRGAHLDSHPPSSGGGHGKEMSAVPRTIEWVGDVDGFVRIIDQTLLPTQLTYRDLRTVEDVWEAIKTLRIRGAPAIGVAAAMGVVVGLQQWANLGSRLAQVCDYLATSRPPAVNLFWALERMQAHFRRMACEEREPRQLREAMLKEALTIEAEDRAMCRAIGNFGAELVPDGGGVLTHCNAGG